MTVNPKPNRLEQALGHNAGVLAQFTETQIKEAENRIVAAVKAEIGDAKAAIIKAAGIPESITDRFLRWLEGKQASWLMWVCIVAVGAACYLAGALSK